MSRKSGTSGSKGRGTSADDDELWQHTARSLEPLKHAQPRVHRAASKDPETVAATMRAAESPPHTTHSHRTPADAPAHSHYAANTAKTGLAKKPPAELGTFDPRHARKLRRGHIEIEGRIDLHGKRQSEAHVALYRFLITSAAKGRRWVLVITGKGAPAARSVDKDEHWTSGEPQRGILRRNVPLWLSEPELRGLVVSFTEAAIEHGGSGALYVHLRRQHRPHE